MTIDNTKPYNNLIKKSISHEIMYLSAHILANILRADM